VVVTAGFTGVVYGLIQAATHSWGSTNVLIPLIGGLLLVGAFAVIESRVAAPLVPISFFNNRTRVVTNATTVLFTAAFFTMFFLLTLYFQEVKHWSALKTGLAYLPFGIGIGGGIGLASSFVPKLGFKPVMAAGFVLFGLAMAWMSTITPSSSYWLHLMPSFVLAALGAGFDFAAAGNASVHEVTVEDASLASGVQSAVQQVGGGIGIAVLATIALRHATAKIAAGISPGIAATDGYGVAFLISAILMAIGVAMVFLLLEGEHGTEAAAASAPLAETSS
jgi:predicted MFS family arabinose efflux permease